VPNFDNRTFDREVEFELREALIKEIEQRTPYKVVRTPGAADTLLEGTVVEVQRSAISRQQGTGLPQEVEVTVMVDFVWRDLRSGEDLRGYRGMGPVRVGNHAYLQRQHDVYGAIVLASAHSFFDERLTNLGDTAQFRQLEHIGSRALAVHDRPDAGPWEFRGFERVHTFSAAMCWAGLDRLARIAVRLGVSDRAGYWRGEANRLRSHILEHAWNPVARVFTSSYGGQDLDATALLLPELGLVEATDPRFTATLEAIDAGLRAGDWFYRYRHRDDFGTPETAFTICAFWYVNALAMAGRREQAREHFERLLSHRTRLGLLSEDIDPATGEWWGNFPQTYSLVGIVNSAIRLSRSWEEAL